MSAAPDSPPSARQDLIGGLLSVALGAYALAEASTYPMGSLLRMGPGLFPCMIAALIIALGAVLIINAMRRRPPAEGPEIRIRSVVTIGVAILLFALLLERVGLIPATALLVLVSSLAEPQWRPRRAIALAVGVTALVYVIFVVILHIPVPALRLG
jgi:hypothetical protein